MPIVSVPTAPYTPGTFATQFSAVLPTSFRLKLKLGKLLPAARNLFPSHAAIIEFDTQGLLALAPLRHGGAPYTDGIAIAKETLLWFGWLSVHSSGPLLGRLLVSHAKNAGRQAEFSGGLAECISVAILHDILRLPLATIQRIPESGPAREGMDFRTSGADASAIESKAGHGSCVKGKRRTIAGQMRKQRVAVNKYGAILCYQKDKKPALKKDGSFLYVYDPPKRTRDDLPEAPPAIVLHYLQIAQAIGFWILVDGIRSALGMPAREHALAERDRQRMLTALAEFSLVHPEGDGRRASLVRLARYGPGIAFAVSGRAYLARAFQYEAILGLGNYHDPYPRPITVLGLSQAVAGALARYALGGEIAALERAILDPELRAAQSFARRLPYGFGHIHYTGLEDGVVRVDLISLSQLLTETLDI